MLLLVDSGVTGKPPAADIVCADAKPRKCKPKNGCILDGDTCADFVCANVSDLNKCRSKDGCIVDGDTCVDKPAAVCADISNGKKCNQKNNGCIFDRLENLYHTIHNSNNKHYE